MASTKEVRVVIDGEEHVSQAAQSAAGGLEIFGKKIPFVIDLAGLLEKGLALLGDAIGKVKDFAMDSIRAYDDYAAAQMKLAAQSKLTGIPLSELKEIARKAREEFGLSTVASIELTGSAGKFAAQAGVAGRSAELMAAALELGAASGLNASEVADGLTSALAGNDEFLNKLGLANPSQIWKDYAAANGIAVKEMDTTTQKLAILNAITEAAGLVHGTLAERMASGAGAQDRLNNTMESAKVAFGAAIQPIRILTVQALTGLINIVTPVIVNIGRLANFVGEIFVGAFQLARSAVGSLAEGVGKLTGMKSLEEWGKAQSQAFPNFVEQLKKMEKQLDGTKDAATEHGKAHELAAVKITASADATKKATEVTKAAADAYYDKASAKLGKPLADLIGLTTTAIGRLGDAGKNQLDPMSAEQFAKHMQHLREEADKGNTAVVNLGKNVKPPADDVKKIADDMGTVARGALDAAEAFGVIDDNAARSLQSAVNIADALKKMSDVGFSFTGVVGIIGGVANIVSMMMAGDAARRQLLRENNAAIGRLSKDIGGLKLNITGEDFAKASSALAGLTFKGGVANAPGNAAALMARLTAQGLDITDLKRIGEEIGISIFDKNGNIVFDAITQLGNALGALAPGRLGQSFADQFDFFKQGQNLDNVTGLDKVGGMLSFLRNVGGVTALNGIDLSNPAEARRALRNLVEQFNNGQGVEGLGRLTGSQLMDVLVQLIGEIDNAGAGAVVTGGGVSMPTSSITSTASAATSSVADILAGHTDLHSRVADATEESARRLASIDDKMSALLAQNAGSTDRVDAALEEQRFMLALQQGIGVAY